MKTVNDGTVSRFAQIAPDHVGSGLERLGEAPHGIIDRVRVGDDHRQARGSSWRCPGAERERIDRFLVEVDGPVSRVRDHVAHP